MSLPLSPPPSSSTTDTFTLNSMAESPVESGTSAPPSDIGDDDASSTSSCCAGEADVKPIKLSLHTTPATAPHARTHHGSGVWLSEAPISPDVAKRTAHYLAEPAPEIQSYPAWSHHTPDHAYHRKDFKCPCPAIATLANHGYINPRSPQDRIPYFTLVHGLMLCYNIHWFNAMFLCLVATVLCGNVVSVSMVELGVHGRVEHDASMTRHNQNTNRDWRTPDEGRIRHLFGLCKTKRYVTQEDFALIRCERERDLEKPDTFVEYWWQRSKLAALGRGEVGLATLAFGKPEDRAGDDGLFIRSDWLATWFREERLPDDWERPTEPITIWNVVQIAYALNKRMKMIRQKDPQMEQSACPASYRRASN